MSRFVFTANRQKGVGTVFQKWKNSYGMKLIVSLVGLVMVSMLLMSGIYYAVMSNMLIEENQNALKDLSGQISNGVNGVMENVQRFAQSVVLDPKLPYYCTKTRFTSYEANEFINDYLLPRAQTEFGVVDFRMGAKLYLDNPSISEHYYTSSTTEEANAYGVPMITDDLGRFEVIYAGRIADTPYYRGFMQDGRFMVWKQVDRDYINRNVSLLVKVVDYTTMRSYGMMRVSISLGDLFSKMEINDLNENVFVRLSGSDGETFYESKNLEDFKEREFLSLSGELQQGNVTLTLLSDKRVITKKLTNTLMGLLGVNLLILLAAILLGLLIRRKLYRQLGEIVIGLKEFRKGNLDYSIPVIADDELGKVSSQLNGFSHSVESLINDVQEAVLENQNIEYQMLQAKVNPHFLYNILSIIKRQAHMGHTEKLEEISDKTAVFYRLALSRKKKVNTVEDEITCVQAYVDILNILYKDNFFVSYEIAPGTERCETPNFIIQPFVENAAKHAMIDGSLHMNIRTEQREGLLWISISDDGIGMNEEKVKALFTENHGGYGVYNVNARIRLFTDDEACGVEIESQPMEGTTVLLKLPYREVNERV